MDKIVVICGTLLCLGILTVAFLDASHKRVIRHACHMAGFSASYDSAHIAQICGK